jgi:hypothetical protein
MERIDTTALLEEAVEEGESFLTIGRWEGTRIGMGARAPCTIFVEVLIPLFPSSSVDLGWIEKALTMLRHLEAHGYRLSCRDDSTVSGEKLIPQEDVEREVDVAMRISGHPE